MERTRYGHQKGVPMMRLLHLFMVLTMLLLPIDAARAHRFAPSLLRVEETTSQSYQVIWKTPIQTTSNVPLEPVFPKACKITGKSPAVQEGTGLVIGWTLDCSALGAEGLVDQTLVVTGLGENQASAIVMLSLRDGRTYQGVVNAENPRFLVPASRSQSAVMSDYSVFGIEHIWSGLDHLMFVFGLLLLVGGGARLLWTITAFTIGHSITLAAVTLRAFDYPVALIEFIIALSIFVVALELSQGLRNAADSIDAPQGGLIRRYPWWLAGGFGLLHGMGFAGALAEIGLPQGNVPLALLFFNLGIEIGQIAFVLLGLAIWWVVRRKVAVNTERWMPWPIYALGALSAMWCIERGLALAS